MKKVQHNDSGPEKNGRLAFESDKPITACKESGGANDKGKRHAWERGWRRAWMAAQKAKS